MRLVVMLKWNGSLAHGASRRTSTPVVSNTGGSESSGLIDLSAVDNGMEGKEMELMGHLLNYRLGLKVSVASVH